MFDDGTEKVESREPSEQIAGRLVGIAVFLTGVVLLVVTFVITYKAFENPSWFIPLQSLSQTPPPSPFVVYAQGLLRIILLLVMGYLGSLIAARGAQLFFSARKEARHGSAGD